MRYGSVLHYFDPLIKLTLTKQRKPNDGDTEGKLTEGNEVSGKKSGGLPG